MRYRMRKMAEITNLALDDAKKRLAMMIQLAATEHRLTVQAVESRQREAARLSEFGKAYGGYPDDHVGSAPFVPTATRR